MTGSGLAFELTHAKGLCMPVSQKSVKRILIGLVCYVLFAPAQADSGFRAQLGSDNVAFTYITEAWGQSIGKLDVEAGLLFNDNDDTLGYVSALVRRDSINSPLTFTLGGRLYYADVNKSDISGLALGGSASYHPPNWGGLTVGGYYFIVPEITSFQDSEGLIDYAALIGYELTRTVIFYGGYQNVEVSITNAGDVTVVDGPFIGISVKFK